jgi:predicted dehydrogenase
MKTIHWGILGTGYAAHQFAQGLRTLPEAKLVAVGSRQQETADTFARQFQIPHAYSRYEDLVNDETIDIVYIATPNPLHKDHCLLCLTAGKAVLCEKPFTLNALEAQTVLALAREKQLFCMEAMWTRFIPLIYKVRGLLADGVIGEPKMLTADFGLRVVFSEQDRHFNPQLGGGALLDLGVYPISLAFYLLGAPATVVSQATIGKTQVDEQVTVLFNYANGLLATLSASFLTELPNEMFIMGSQGCIRVQSPLYRPTCLSVQLFPALSVDSAKATGWQSKFKQNALLRKSYRLLTQFTHKPKKIVAPCASNGYQYQALEAMQCLNDGKLESHIMPLSETVTILKTLDTIRQQWMSVSNR